MFFCAGVLRRSFAPAKRSKQNEASKKTHHATIKKNRDNFYQRQPQALFVFKGASL